MVRNSRWLIIAAVVIAVIAGLRFTVLRPAPVTVEVAVVGRGPVEDVVTNTRAGTVKARTRARLSPQLGGRVIELPFRKGAAVAHGALLLRLDDSVQRAQVSLAREELATASARADEACLAADLARKDWERGDALARDGITSDQALDQLASQRDRTVASCRAVRAALEQARAQVRLGEAELALTEVRAPFDGIVADVSTEVGEWITPAPPGIPIPPVLDLLGPASVYVSAPIDEVDSERVRMAQGVRITIDSRPGASLAGRLARVAPYVVDTQEQNRTVEIEVDFDDPRAAGILPGTSADVEVIVALRNDVLRVPTAAVAEGGRVLVLAQELLSERTIKSGLKNWQFTEVLEGLAAGEKVVTVRNSPDIKPGARAEAVVGGR
jgi:HlyD family secretion protein